METGDILEVDAAPARAAYTAALQEHSRLMAEACSKLNVRLITVRTDEPMDSALRKILPQ
jgi:uncharacterized protein (DUF58 family)